MKQLHRGFSLIDMIGGLAIALALAAIVAAAIVATAQQSRFADQRRVATLELASALEQAMSFSWKDLTTERLAAIRLSPLAEQTLAAAKLRFSLEEIAGQPIARKVVVEIVWNLGPDEMVSPLRLVAWKHAPLEGAK